VPGSSPPAEGHQSIGPGVAGYAYVGESGSSRLRAKTTTLGVLGAATIGLIMTSALPWMLNARSAGGQGWGVKTGQSPTVTTPVRSLTAIFTSVDVRRPRHNLIGRYMALDTRIRRSDIRPDRRVVHP
jgi:hypothetical protein